jgi:hypothetical protein
MPERLNTYIVALSTLFARLRAYSCSVGKRVYRNLAGSPAPRTPIQDPRRGYSPMAYKNNTRKRFTQKLSRQACQPTVERRVHLPNGETLAIAHVNGTYLLGRFKGETPLDARPTVFEGARGQFRAYMEASALAGHTVLPPKPR